jgi:hypothetical protein
VSADSKEHVTSEIEMGWAKDAAERIAAEGRAVVRPPGGSMRGRIESGQLVTLERATLADLSVGDAVFVRWKNGYLLHLVKARVRNHFPIRASS